MKWDDNWISKSPIKSRTISDPASLFHGKNHGFKKPVELNRV